MTAAGASLRACVAAALDGVLTETDLPGLACTLRGKVRDNYDLPDGRRLIIATDRQSAFDQVLAAVPFKGQVLTSVARFWFEATADLCRNHVLAFPDPNVTVARRLSMLPVEVVARDYLAGTTATSVWPMYRDGARVMYGLRFPDGLRKNQRLRETILTPTTKGDAGAHDAPVSAREVLDHGLLTAAQWDEIAAVARALFVRGREIAAGRGLILVDTKYEFGVDASGRITLADEIHTPDSSRYWRADSYPERFERGEDPETLDKDFLRRWIAARCDPYAEPIPSIPAETLVDFALHYIALFETITGAKFNPPPPSPPTALRIRDNVRRYLEG
ncbi:MAG TPA: phosphoribosylaminoimidazolesuccinocarboxamide synthase [Rhodospirillales bacterium]|nr:phosphoribosylaminoimidazolesuccinocarboxamide synthase [Rhodospirillales bacterium]